MKMFKTFEHNGTIFVLGGSSLISHIGERGEVMMTFSQVGYDLNLAVSYKGRCHKEGKDIFCDWFSVSEQQMFQLQTEEYFADMLEEQFIKWGLSTAREVPLGSKRIDIVVYNGSELMAIEVKMSDWKRAFQQALTYRFGAEIVCIAMPKKYIHRVDTKLLEQYGIGLIQIDEQSRVVLEPKRQKYTDTKLRTEIMDGMGRKPPTKLNKIAREFWFSFYTVGKNRPAVELKEDEE